MTPKPKVLIVDDQPENIHALSAILAHDVTALFALTGEQALARVGEGTIDLVLLDVMLPGMNGFEVCSRLKENQATADVPVIFVSALTEHFEEENGFRVGAVDFIHKPFMPTLVRARVRTHLRLRFLLKQAAQLAGTDSMTGVGNRRLFETHAERAMEESRRSGQAMALALVDVDHFKQVNDTFGHLKGDDVLREIAQRGARLARAQDVWCRWGGEEFAWLMIGANRAEARQAADRLRESIARENIRDVGRVTVSLGVAQWGEEAALSAWMERADAALYVAKNGGRNRVELA